MTNSNFGDEIRFVPKAKGNSHTCTHRPLHHLRQKAHSWYFAPIKGQGNENSFALCSAMLRQKQRFVQHGQKMHWETTASSMVLEICYQGAAPFLWGWCPRELQAASQQAQQGDYAAGDMGQVHLLEERRQIILILVSCSFHPKNYQDYYQMW